MQRIVQTNHYSAFYFFFFFQRYLVSMQEFIEVKWRDPLKTCLFCKWNKTVIAFFTKKYTSTTDPTYGVMFYTCFIWMRMFCKVNVWFLQIQSSHFTNAEVVFLLLFRGQPVQCPCGLRAFGCCASSFAVFVAAFPFRPSLAALFPFLDPSHACTRTHACTHTHSHKLLNLSLLCRVSAEEEPG